jgi:hypothetical protein
MSTDLQPTTLPDDNSSLDLNPRAAGSKDSDFELEEKTKAPPKPISSREAIEKAAAEIGLKDEKGLEDDTKPAKAEPKPEPKAKEEPETAEAKAARERGEDGKFKPKEPAEKSDVVDEAAQAESETQPKPSEGKGNREPPARFLPREREEWIKAPNVVRDAVLRVTKEYEGEIAQAKEAQENWKQLEAFDREAKAHGTTVPQYIQNVRAIETLLRTNPVEGIARVLQTAGITPQQYAAHIMGQPQDQKSQQEQQAQLQLRQTIQQQAQALQAMQKELEAIRLEKVADKFIEPFVKDHPRYHELEADIAFFLNSGKIPSSLSEHERLETAYDMAARINPSPQSFDPAPTFTAPEAKRVTNPAGEKSIKGAPGSGNETGRKTKGKLSTRESIEAAMAEMGLGN